MQIIVILEVTIGREVLPQIQGNRDVHNCKNRRYRLIQVKVAAEVI